MSYFIRHKPPDAFFPHPYLCKPIRNQQHGILIESVKENVGYVENCTNSPISRIGTA